MKFLIKLSVAIVTLLVVGTTALPEQANAAFVANRVMDDSVFNNSTSMNGDQIDAFLNTFPSSCISPNSGFRSADVVGYNPSQGFLYGGNVTAGLIIGHAAQAYDLNPQVILATLQKEQSLVSGGAGCHYETPAVQTPCSGPAPFGQSSCVPACQYSGGCVYVAMGYGCPSYCVTGSVGFSKQIIKAAWRLKFTQQRSLGNYDWNIQKPGWDNSDDPQSSYDGYMTQGYFKRNASSSYVNYDGFRTVSNPTTTVHLGTGATAALYSYTPSISGGQSFVARFEQWFGSVHGNVIGQYAYRLYNPGRRDHNFTAIENQREGIKGLGFRDDGIAFKVSPTQEPGMVPIYRMYNGRIMDYWMVPDGMNRYWGIIYGGYKDEGVAFYAYPANTGSSGSICPQGQAIFQLWHGGAGDHYYTTSQEARYWSLIYGGYIDDRSGSYNSDWQGSSAFCVPY